MLRAYPVFVVEIYLNGKQRRRFIFAGPNGAESSWECELEWKKKTNKDGVLKYNVLRWNLCDPQEKATR